LNDWLKLNNALHCWIYLANVYSTFIVEVYPKCYSFVIIGLVCSIITFPRDKRLALVRKSQT